MPTQTTKRKPFQGLFLEDDSDLIGAPAKLFHPYRLLIMKALVLHGNVEFRQLRHNIPEITDGNLATHLGVLEKLQYVRCHKEVINRKIRTSFEITKDGKDAFKRFVDSLKRLIENEPEI